ncbi:NAD-binding protein [Fomitopsis schrenkii]|uniref:NAD-binding protein n=1 Tax=Fomitopsis schrenkii TaxID=2126942 RepID=S8DRL7_FOMSC|nr:NAD-binding protein [Fomitopsis schrenkii]
MPTYAVVGSSRGVGLEIVRQLAPTKNIVLLQADVVDYRSLKTVAEQVAQVTGGSLDVLIHNAAKMDYAGGNIYRSLTEYPSMDALDTEFIEAFKVNTLGAIHSVDAFLPLLRKGSTKKVIIISSGGGERDVVWKARTAELASYGVTKCAENMVMTKYAASLEEEGFVVAAISPGNVDVSETAVAPPTVDEQADLKRTMDKIRKVYPNYPDKATAPEQAVKKVIAVINALGPDDTATFLNAALA